MVPSSWVSDCLCHLGASGQVADRTRISHEVDVGGGVDEMESPDGVGVGMVRSVR